MTKRVLVVAMLCAAAIAPTRAQAAGPNCYRHSIGGTLGDDVIHGTEVRDGIVSYEGDDVVFGKGGRDWICGGPNDDELNGGMRADDLMGGFGNDTIYGGRGADNMNGGDGYDVCYVDALDRYWTSCEEVISQS